MLLFPARRLMGNGLKAWQQVPRQGLRGRRCQGRVGGVPRRSDALLAQGATAGSSRRRARLEFIEEVALDPTAPAKLRPCGETRYCRSRSCRRPGSRTRCTCSRTCYRPAGSGGGSSAPGWPACSGGRTGSTPQTRGSCLPCQHSRPQQRRVGRPRSSTRRVHLRAQRVDPNNCLKPRRSPPQFPECRGKPAPLARPFAFGYDSPRHALSRPRSPRPSDLLEHPPGPSRPTASNIWRRLPRSRPVTCQISRFSPESCMSEATASHASVASVMPTGMRRDRPSSGSLRHGGPAQGRT